MRSEPLGSIHSGLLGDATLADRLGAALRDALGERVRGELDALRVRARTPGDVSALFRIAAQHGARMAAPGGELTPGVGVVSLDLDALAQIRSLDAESRIVHVEGGALLGAVEAHLRAAGLTLGVATLDAATLDAATLDAATGARHAARAEARAISAAAEARVDVASSASTRSRFIARPSRWRRRSASPRDPRRRPTRRSQLGRHHTSARRPRRSGP